MNDIQLDFNLYNQNYVSSIFVLFVDIEKLDYNLLGHGTFTKINNITID